jgi:hypothetical protein
MHPSICGFGRVGDTAISDPTTDRIPEAVMTVMIARAVHIMVARRHGTAPERLNATLSNTAAKRLKAVIIRGSVEEENTKALKFRIYCFRSLKLLVLDRLAKLVVDHSTCPSHRRADNYIAQPDVMLPTTDAYHQPKSNGRKAV